MTARQSESESFRKIYDLVMAETRP
jgi:hypothetical protein